METEVKVFHGHSAALVDMLWGLEKEIFDNPYSKEKITRESSVKPNLISLVACIKEEAVGYKVGYEMSSRLFYSWMGGVVPAHRNKGIAGRLMAEQHKLIKQQGYKLVRTHTENRYRDMLILNLRTGFDVVGLMQDNTKPKTVIVLDKVL